MTKRSASSGATTESRAAPLIVFDGTCVLCSAWVAFVLRHGARTRFRFATTQSSAGKALMAANGLESASPSTFLFVDPGGAYTESDAVVRMFRAFGGMWRLGAVVRLIPKALRDAAYRWVARNRYRWFGRRAECFVPSAADRDRFLV
jgi:predicted DCC family thiol-disulfide oxidoreductase YuxK